MHPRTHKLRYVSAVSFFLFALTALVLSFAGGAILAMLSTTMMPEAYEHAKREVGLATTVGFAVAFAIHLSSG